MASSLRRLVLLVVALGVAAVLLVGVTTALTPAAPPKASPVLQRDHARAVERSTTRTAAEPAPKGSRSFPVVPLVLGGLLLLATLLPTYRVNVYLHRPPGSYYW
jgi:hypothetical protein